MANAALKQDFDKYFQTMICFGGGEKPNQYLSNEYLTIQFTRYNYISRMNLLVESICEIVQLIL